MLAQILHFAAASSHVLLLATRQTTRRRMFNQDAPVQAEACHNPFSTAHPWTPNSDTAQAHPHDGKTNSESCARNCLAQKAVAHEASSEHHSCPLARLPDEESHGKEACGRNRTSMHVPCVEGKKKDQSDDGCLSKDVFPLESSLCHRDDATLLKDQDDPGMVQRNSDSRALEETPSCRDSDSEGLGGSLAALEISHPPGCLH
mmetsp:Transcript_109125/g.189416  ORF Transcript_109125/g.189416 Transcript_109125/m.189416 type:complete len:203 (+) Transcript_109125:442-1050(+)